MAMSSASSSSHPPRTPVDADVDMDDPDTENDEEIDQLDSDTTEDEDIPATDAPAGSAASKARLKKSGERVPGHSVIPISRIEDMLDAEGLAGQMSKEAVFLIAVAAEEFVKRLTEAGRRNAGGEQRSLINYFDLALAVHDQPDLSFLEETIPTPMSVTDALERRIAREKELLESEPALVTAMPSPMVISAAPTPPPLTASTSASTSKATRVVKPRGKAKEHHEPTMGTFSAASTPITIPQPAPTPPRATRGKGKAREPAARTNGHAHPPIDVADNVDVVIVPSAPASVPPEEKPTLGTGAAPTRRAAKNAAAAISAAAHENGDETPPPTRAVSARRQSLREPKPRRRADDADDVAPPKAKRARRSTARSNGTSASATHINGDAPSAPAPHLPAEYVEAHRDVSGGLTGPGSGYAESNGSGSSEGKSLFGGRNGITDAPGRTIYSR